MAERNAQWLIPVLLALGAALALWFYWASLEPGPETSPAGPSGDESATDAPAGPRYPVPDPPPHRPAAAELTPLPPLDESDRYFELALEDLFGEGVDALLIDNAVIERFTAAIDNLPRRRVAERIRPVSGAPGTFLVDGQDASGAWTISAENYRRYDGLVAMLRRADPAALTDVYRRFYPLFQAAYEGLGYPDGYFNDRLVAVIDHLLETPDVSGPVEVVRPHVLYEYADPELEALSAGQKLLIRIGPDNRAAVREFLVELRARIVALAE